MAVYAHMQNKFVHMWHNSYSSTGTQLALTNIQLTLMVNPQRKRPWQNSRQSGRVDPIDDSSNDFDCPFNHREAASGIWRI